MQKFLFCLPPLIALVAVFLSMATMARDVVKIGAIYSLTGPASGVACMQKNATELAIKEINQSGGIDLGSKKVELEVVFGDDQYDPAKAAALFEGMVKRQGVVAMIGGTWGHNVLATNSGAAKEDPIFFVSCAVSDASHRCGVKGWAALGTVGPTPGVGTTEYSRLSGNIESRNVRRSTRSVAFVRAVASGRDAVTEKSSDIKYYNYWYQPSSNTKHGLRAACASKLDVVMIETCGEDKIAATDETLKTVFAREAKFCDFWFGEPSAIAVDSGAIKGVPARLFWNQDMTGIRGEGDIRAYREFTARFGKAYSERLEAYVTCSYSAVKEVARLLEAAQDSDLMKMSQALSAIQIWTGSRR